MLYGHQGILKSMPVRRVVVNVVGGNHAHARLSGQLRQLPVAAGVSLDQVLLQFHKDAGCAEPVQVFPQLVQSFMLPSLAYKAG